MGAIPKRLSELWVLGVFCFYSNRKK